MKNPIVLVALILGLSLGLRAADAEKLPELRGMLATGTSRVFALTSPNGDGQAA